MEKKQTFTREEVIQLIDNMLQYADAVMDAISSEDPEYDAEELLELSESTLKH